MNRLRAILAARMLVVFLFSPLLARADDFDTELLNPDTFQIDDGMGGHSGHSWELMVAPVYAILTGPKYQDIDFSNGPAIEAGLYYQVLQFCQIGLAGGYSFSHENDTVLSTFNGIEFVSQERLEVARALPVIRLGGWMNGPGSMKWHPYIEGGAGWYELIRRSNIDLEASQFLAKAQLSEVSTQYLGAQAGGGIEAEVYPQGIVGLYVGYNRVFSRPQNLEFFTPSLRLSYLF